MANTRRFTSKGQQMLEEFIESDKVLDLINVINDKEKCKKWVNKNSEIKDALDKGFNNEYGFNIKDKFLWILSDIVNCQLDEKATTQHKQINTFKQLKDFLILLGLNGAIKGIKKVTNVDFIEDNKHLEKVKEIFLDSYSLKQKNYTPLNRIDSFLRQIDESYDDNYIQKFLQEKLSQAAEEEDIILENAIDLMLYVSEKRIPSGFEELEEENVEEGSIKRKREEYINENNNVCKKAFYHSLKCTGESIPDSDPE